MKEWLSNLTFRDWVTIVLGLFAVVGFVNAFLSLKSRWKDWRASKSKKGLEKRLTQLSKLISEIADYQKTPNKYFATVAYELARIVAIFAFSATALVVIQILRTLRQGDNVIWLWSILMWGIVALILFLSSRAADKLVRLTRYYRFPRSLVLETLRLIKKGKDNGYIPDNESKIIKLINETKISLDTEGAFLKAGVDNLEEDKY